MMRIILPFTIDFIDQRFLLNFYLYRLSFLFILNVIDHEFLRENSILRLFDFTKKKGTTFEHEFDPTFTRNPKLPVPTQIGCLQIPLPTEKKDPIPFVS